MGFDIGQWTVRVLEGGLPPLPAQLERGQTVPVALWRGERYGAVLFVRLWKNGNADSDCAISERARDGAWEEPSSWGGGSWIDDPLVRPSDGWDGDQVAWLGSFGIGGGGDDEIAASAGDGFGMWDVELLDSGKERRVSEPWAGLGVRALLGAASAQVAAIEVEHDARRWRVPIDSPCGAFIVGLEAPGLATMRAIDHGGRPLADADGRTEHVT